MELSQMILRFSIVLLIAFAYNPTWALERNSLIGISNEILEARNEPTGAENAQERFRLIRKWIKLSLIAGNMEIVRQIAPKNEIEKIERSLWRNDSSRWSAIDSIFQQISTFTTQNGRVTAEGQKEAHLAKRISIMNRGKDLKNSLPDIQSKLKTAQKYFDVNLYKDKSSLSDLQSIEKQNKIEIVVEGTKLVVVTAPTILTLTLNHWHIIPLHLEGGEDGLWRIETEGSVFGDIVQPISGFLFVKTLIALPHPLKIKFYNKLKIVEVELQIQTKRIAGRPFFGIQDHFDRFPPGLTNKALDDMVLMQDLPSLSYRMPLAWPLIEKKRGEANWDRWNWYAKGVQQRGQLLLLGGLGRVPAWRGKTGSLLKNENLMSDYRGYVTETVRRFADQVSFWSMGNEPLAYWWKQYIKKGSQKYIEDCGQIILSIVKEASAIIRSLDSEAVILPPGFVDGSRNPIVVKDGKERKSISFAMLQWLLENQMADYVDAIQVHNYAAFGINKGYLRPMKAKYLATWRKYDQKADSSGLLALMDKHNIRKPIWTTEFGGFRLQDDSSKDEMEAQAIALLRSATIIAHQRGEGIFFFELFDYNHHNDLIGSYLLRNDDHKELLAFSAYRQIIRSLTGAAPFVDKKFSGSKEQNDDYTGLVYKMFTRTDEDILTFWSNDPSAVHIALKGKSQAPFEDFVSYRVTRFQPGGPFGVTQDITDVLKAEKEHNFTIKPFEFLIIETITAKSGFSWLSEIRKYR